MHISDVAVHCAQECVRIAERTGDAAVAASLMQIAQRLEEAARRDSELVVEGASIDCSLETADQLRKVARSDEAA
jgi:hypothetical protein